MPTSQASTAALVIELIGLAYGAGLLWLGASLRADATTLDRWRTPSLVLSTALTAAGLWWPGHLHLESHGWASGVSLLAALLLPWCADAFARDASGTRAGQGSRDGQSRKAAATKSAQASRGKRAPGLAVPAAIATSVVFVFASAPRVLETGSAAGFAMVVGTSIGLLVLMVGLRHAKALPWQRAAASVVASVLVTMIEWAPPSKHDAGALTLQLVTMVVVLGLAATLVGMLRHTRSKVAALTVQKDREALERDPLTHLPTHRAFDAALAQAVSRTNGEREPLVLLFIDLDGFKAVNQSYGHAEGDRVIVEMARRLSKVARESDVLARIGADDFLLLSREDTELKAAEALAQRIIMRLELPYALSQQHVSLTCSVGIVRYPKHGPADQLVARADAAAQSAKRDGGGRHCVYETSMDTGARERLALGTELRAAIERGGLELYYQPKVDAASTQITGAEALVRWNHPWHGLLGPAAFVPMAEQSGLIEPLGNWVIEEACRQIGAWRESGFRMRVSINLSPPQLRQTDLVPKILESLRKHRVEPSLLTCEITESVAMSDTKTTQETMRALGEAGIHVSIDDFGTGYSSLSYLRKLPAEELKIDRSFVSDLEHSADARAVADAVVKLAHALGLKVVAEGVENEAQSELLIAMGCNQLQGYFYGKPMPADHLLAWAMDHRKRRDEVSTSFRPSLFVEEA